MRIWLIESGEPLPIDNTPGRPWRVGLLAEHLWNRGHDITWWAGTFDHTHKVHRASESKRIDYRDRFSFRLLHGAAYGRNVSVARLWNHYQVAREFSRKSKEEARPDGILCCVPTLELAKAAVDYGQWQGIPVIVDYRDLWPDVFTEPFPRALHPFVRVFARPWFRMAHKVFSGAAAITGITDGFVQRALTHARRTRQASLDQSFPHGYSADPVEYARLEEAFRFWADRGIVPKHEEFIVTFFGQMGRRIQLKAAVLAVRQLARAGHLVKLVLCGKGELEEACRRWAEGSDAVVLAGYVGQPEIQALMMLSQAGILPYPSTTDFSASIPNKVIEYFSGGLPVLSSVRGVVHDMLHVEGAGLTYTNNSPASLAEAICKYIADPDLRKLHAGNAVRLFERKFSADRVYSSMADHLESIILAPRGIVTA